jgi:hypothetical protein
MSGAYDPAVRDLMPNACASRDSAPCGACGLPTITTHGMHFCFCGVGPLCVTCREDGHERARPHNPERGPSETLAHWTARNCESNHPALTWSVEFGLQRLEHRRWPCAWPNCGRHNGPTLRVPIPPAPRLALAEPAGFSEIKTVTYEAVPFRQTRFGDVFAWVDEREQRPVG